MNLSCKIEDFGFKKKKSSEANQVKEITNDFFSFLIKNNNTRLFLANSPEEIVFPEKNNTNMFLTNKAFNSTFILSKVPIDDLKISFSTINDEAISILNRIKNKTVIARILSNEEFFAPNVENINCQVFKKSTHAKIYLIKSGDNYYSVITTVNPKSGDKQETYTIHNRIDVYEALAKIFIEEQIITPEVFKLPTKNETLTTYHKKGKSTIDLIDEVMQEENILELSIVQYILTTNVIKNLRKYKNIPKINLSLSLFMRYQESFKLTLDVVKEMNINFKMTYNHAKIILIKTEKNNYVINSSANLGSNSKIETTEIINSDSIYNEMYKLLNLK